MNAPSHDFVTVDMRGLKSALAARAQAERTTVSSLVRSAVARELGVEVEGLRPRELREIKLPSQSIKLSIRMTAMEVEQLDAGARAAGLSRPAYLAGLIAGVPVLTNGGGRTEAISGLVASNAELAELSRDLRHLTSLLARGESQAARFYRERLDQLADEVRAHLRLGSRVLSELQPQRGPGGTRP
jgi:hypothetical protein